jgi:hypothetical protein
MEHPSSAEIPQSESVHHSEQAAPAVPPVSAPDLEAKPSLEAEIGDTGHPDSPVGSTPEESLESVQPEQEPAEAPEDSPVVPGSLEDFATRAGKGRLSPDEELEATRLLKECLLGGRSEVARAVKVTPQLPWVVTVQATASVWAEIKPTFRSQFLAGLARTSGEAAARMRLSLARGLFKVDPTAALKLILLTLKVLRNKETGLLEGKGAPTLASVLIGRGKAWILQLPLTELKPAEADLLVFAALHGAFHQPQAPLTQLSILKWASAAGRLVSLPQALEQMVLKGVSRWSAKWQASLRREVSPLPDSWVEVLKTPPAALGTSSVVGASGSPETGSGESPADDGEVRTSGHSSTDGDGDVTDSEESPKPFDREEEEDDDDSDETHDDDADESLTKRQKQRPVYVSKTVPNHGHQGSNTQSSRRGVSQSFNLQETLRQVEQYVAGLRTELQSAQKQLRQREDDRRHRRNDKPAPVVNPGELSLEEAIRLNHQLEFRNGELQARIDEMTADSEARATSRGLASGSPVQDTETELRSLLGFKLKEDFEDFQALEQEARDIVVQQHYRTLLRHVFEVLEAEGVRFDLPPAEAK